MLTTGKHSEFVAGCILCVVYLSRNTNQRLLCISPTTPPASALHPYGVYFTHSVSIMRRESNIPAGSDVNWLSSKFLGRELHLRGCRGNGRQTNITKTCWAGRINRSWTLPLTRFVRAIPGDLIKPFYLKSKRGCYILPGALKNLYLRSRNAPTLVKHRRQSLFE